MEAESKIAPNSSAPAAKKSKTSTPLDEIVSSAVLAQESEIRGRYEKSTPYPHAQIHGLFDPSFLNGVKEEIKSQAKVNFKESDLFRVYQSVDMANLDTQPELAKELPNVMKLREVLYSQEWRSFIERLACLPPSTLTSKIDCACNCHAPGCHLLCHDDVIGTRKISYIIYLTEPDWKPQEGGSLELYGPQTDNDPNSVPLPSARVWPDFNSMAFFVVQPGASYHAVQEVLGDRPRLSLQGWYHATEPPENIELATLQQLKKVNDDEDGEGADKAVSKLHVNFGEEVVKEFSDEDKAFLSKYLKDEYLTYQSIQEVQKKFINDSSVQLRNFLQEKWVPKVEALKPPKYDDEYYKTGISSEWKLQGPAHKQRYLEYKADAKSHDCPMIGSLLHHVKTKVFESAAFGRYLKELTSLEGANGVKTSQIRRFRPGLDYTVAHYGLLMNESVLDATMCFVYDPTEDEQAMWESGDCGGFECYIEADDEEEDPTGGAADEYNEDDDTELLSVSASNNTLSLVYRDPGTMRFVKYVGSSAPSSRYDICVEYQVPPSDDAEEAEDLDKKPDATAQP